jgi:hypothetical protein
VEVEGSAGGQQPRGNRDLLNSIPQQTPSLAAEALLEEKSAKAAGSPVVQVKRSIYYRPLRPIAVATLFDLLVVGAATFDTLESVDTTRLTFGLRGVLQLPDGSSREARFNQWLSLSTPTGR